MAEINITLNGKTYTVACDDGQEGRVTDLAAHVSQRLQQIARSGAAFNDAHLLVLTSLVLADELFEARESVPSRGRAAVPPPVPADTGEQQILLRVLDQVAQRIDGLAARVQTS